VNATTRSSAADPAIRRARRAEDVLVGEEIVRHRLASRVIHWTVALSFFLALFTGLPIWTPVFGWTAQLFGGLHVCRWLHPWAGLLFFLAVAAMFAHWLGDMRLEPRDREWLRPRKIAAYLKHEGDDAEEGKYNGGQKLFFFAAALGAVGLMASGLVLWLPMTFARPVSEAAILLHDVTFILFVVAVILHIYLGTAAEPGTFHSMVRGTVSRPWARLHHPRWYREVTSEQRRP
jgi:formate dehydrogenase subunit gamma